MEKFNHDITMEKLQEAFGHYRIDADLQLVLDLLNGAANLDDNAAVQALCRSCFHSPDRNHQLMTALNYLLAGFGVGVIRDENHWDKYYGDAVIKYISMGDTYADTIVHDLATDEYHVMSWGDAQEAYEQSIIDTGPCRDDFDRLLCNIIRDMSPDDLLDIPGVYESIAEHLTNDVLDAWADEVRNR